MKVVLLLIVFSISTFLKAQENISVSSYNIRLDLASDSPNHWDNRKADVASLILFHKVEILGVQEALHHQMLDLDSLLPHYSWVGVGRDDGAQKGEYSAIFYNKNRFGLISSGTFWLSETSAKPSKGWDAALPRVCTWAILEQKDSGKKLFLMNTHFDHVGQQARVESAKLILQKSKDLNADHLPLVIMGDLNATAMEEPIQTFSHQLKNSEALANIKMGSTGTFNGFKWNESPQNTIDYIFVDEKWWVHRYGIITQSSNQRYPSDHFPVLVELGWK